MPGPNPGMRKLIIALFALLLAAPATAQQFPTVHDRTVIGRIGTGSGSGPSQEIPFANITPYFLSSFTGDCNFASPFISTVITCLKTNGVPFGTFATANFATPPAIGGTTPAPGSFSTLSATGTFSGAGGSFGSLTDTGIFGSTQCVQANSSGVFSGTGAGCAAGGGLTGNNLVRNAGLGLTTGISTVLVGVPGASPQFTVAPVVITGWAQQGGAGSGNVRFTTSGGNAGLQPGKLVAIMGGTNTMAMTATVTGGNTITATGPIFTQSAGDLLWITGGNNGSSKTQFRVVSVSGCSGACTTAVVNGPLVNETSKTYYITGIQGGYAIDATVNGMPQAGNIAAPAFYYYPLQVTQVGTNFFDAQMAGKNLNVGASGTATAWEITNGAQQTSCQSPDWWICTSTLSIYKMRGIDWDGSTVVNKPGALYSFKLVKGATTSEAFYQDLATVAPSTQLISSINLTTFAGKSLTCGAYIWTPNASQGRLFIFDGTTTTNSLFVAPGSYQWIEVSATLSTTLSTAQWGLQTDAGAIGDTFKFTQPICKFGAGTIGAGNYVPAPPTLHMFLDHTNPFYYINVAVPANTFINIEQETSGCLPAGLESVQADIGGANVTVGAALQLSDSPGPPQMSALVNINPVNSAVQTANQTGQVAITRRGSGDGQFVLDSQWINVNGSATWTKVTVDYLGGVY
jgi:hypothetical protein